MNDTMGSRLKELRIRKKLTQDQIADMIGVNKSAISYYETDNRQPSYAVLMQFAEIYNVSADYILGIKEKSSPFDEGLSDMESSLLKNLAQEIKEKNKRLEKYKKRIDELESGKK